MAEDEDDDEADEDFSVLRLKSRVSVLDGMLSSPLTEKRKNFKKIKNALHVHTVYVCIITLYRVGRQNLYSFVSKNGSEGVKIFVSHPVCKLKVEE